MNPHGQEQWLETIKALHQPEVGLDDGPFTAQLSGRIRRRRRQRIVGLTCAVVMLIGAFIYRMPAQEHAGSASDSEINHPLTQRNKELSIAPDGETTGLNVAQVEQTAQFDHDLLADSEALFHATDRDWAEIDDSLGEEYLAFVHLIETTTLKETL